MARPLKETEDHYWIRRTENDCPNNFLFEACVGLRPRQQQCHVGTLPQFYASFIQHKDVMISSKTYLDDLGKSRFLGRLRPSERFNKQSGDWSIGYWSHKQPIYFSRPKRSGTDGIGSRQVSDVKFISKILKLSDI